MAVEITSPEELEAWLDGKPTGLVQALGVRSSLRALPVVFESSLYAAGVITSRLPLTIFRSNAIAVGYYKVPPQFPLPEPHAEAWTASIAAADEADGVGPTPDRLAAYSAGEAAFYAAYTIFNAAGESTVKNATRTLAEAANALGFVDFGFWVALSSDCKAIIDGIAPDKFLNSPLRPSRSEGWERSWDQARKWLSASGQGFEIWREWYYGRIEGLPHAFADFTDAADEKFYRWIAQQGDAWWSREPAVVNADITEFVDALRQSSPTDEELQQNPRAFTFALGHDGRSDLDDETLPNGLQGDADERDNHAEILRLIEHAILATAGNTNAKDMDEPTQLLKEAVGEGIEALRPRFFVLRAGEIIRQVNERESGESMKPQLSEKQRDAYLPLVAALKMIAEFSPKLAELWHGKLGQTGTPLSRDMLDLIAEALRTSGQTTALAQSVIEASNRQVSPDAPEDDPARIAASETSRNAFRKMGGTLKKAGEGAKQAENIISLGERVFKIWSSVRGKLPSEEVIMRILSSFGGGGG